MNPSLSLPLLALAGAVLVGLSVWPLWRTLHPARGAARARAAPGEPRSGVWPLWGVPLVVALMYGLTGDPLAVQRGAQRVEGGDARAQAQAMSEQLAAALAEAERTGSDAGTPEAWVWLAQLQAGLRRFDEAQQAYGRALALRPDTPQWLIDRADLYLMVHGARDGEAERLIARALALAPGHPKALAIAGGLAHDRGETERARRLWTQARAAVPDGSAFAADLERSLAASAGATAATPGQAAAPDPATVVSGTVTLAPALRARITPEATVFVVVRAAGSGPRMPLAVQRHTVADLPLRFALDADDAMTPTAGWTAGESLEVQALVSMDGDARAKAGDLLAAPVTVKAGAAAATLRLDQVRP